MTRISSPIPSVQLQSLEPAADSTDAPSSDRKASVYTRPPELPANVSAMLHRFASVEGSGPGCIAGEPLRRTPPRADPQGPAHELMSIVSDFDERSRPSSIPIAPGP